MGIFDRLREDCIERISNVTFLQFLFVQIISVFYVFVVELYFDSLE